MVKLPKNGFCCALGFDLEELAANATSNLRADSADKLPIDDFLDRLAYRKRKPKLDPQAVSFYTLLGGSLHGWMRSYLRFTFMDLRAFEPSRRADMIAHMQTLHSDAMLLQASIRRFMEAHLFRSTLPYMHEDESYAARVA